MAMPVLHNPRHERFAQEAASGKGPSDAYRAAGFETKNAKSISVSASRLLAQPSIQGRIQEILLAREAIHAQSTALAVEKAGLTKQWVIDRLVENVERAMQAEEVKAANDVGTGEYQYNGAVANRALELLGKELGMFIDRREIGEPGEFDRMTEDELRQFLAQEEAVIVLPVQGSDTQH